MTLEKMYFKSLSECRSRNYGAIVKGETAGGARLELRRCEVNNGGRPLGWGSTAISDTH